ncbi:MAG: hypothetical protein WBM02_02645 [bacterium]
MPGCIFLLEWLYYSSPSTRDRAITAFLITTGIVVLLQGIVLNDAAFAFRSTGMPTVSALLFGSVAADTLAGVPAIIMACV